MSLHSMPATCLGLVLFRVTMGDGGRLHTSGSHLSKEPHTRGEILRKHTNNGVTNRKPQKLVRFRNMFLFLKPDQSLRKNQGFCGGWSLTLLGCLCVYLYRDNKFGTYIYIYVCVCVYIYIYKCVCVWINACTYLCEWWLYVNAWIDVNTMDLCEYALAHHYACAFACFTCIHNYAHVCTDSHTYTMHVIIWYMAK